MNRFFLFAILLAVAVTAGAIPLFAQTSVWTPPAGSDLQFLTGANWTPAGVPITGEAFVGNGSATLGPTLNGNATLSILSVGGNSTFYPSVPGASWGAFKQTSGNLTFTLDPADTTYFRALLVGGRGATSQASTYTMTGGSINSNEGRLYVGSFGGQGQLDATNGSLAFRRVYIGGAVYDTDGGGTGTMTLTNSSLTSEQRTLVGVRDGVGSLVIDGASTLTESGWLSVGVWGGTGTLTLNQGAINQISGYWATVGDGVSATHAAHGTVNINGGTVNLNTTGGMTIATWGSSGVWNQNGGETTINAAAQEGLRFGAAGGGETGTLNLNGGTFTVPNIWNYYDVAVASQINFNGGTLKANKDNSDWINISSTTAGGIVVKAGGAKIDTDTFTIAINEPLLADSISTGGGLTKLGSGPLFLSAKSTYQGPTDVTAGSLTVRSLGSLATTSINMADGTTLNLAKAACLTNSLTSFTWGNNATLGIGLTPSATTPSTTANAIDTAAFNLNGGSRTIALSALGRTLDTANDYIIVNAAAHSGTSTFTVTNNTRYYTATASLVGNNVVVNVNGSDAVTNLVWTGAASADWVNDATQNWTNGGSPDRFYDLDSVTFDYNGSPVVNVVGQVHPRDMTFEEIYTEYTFSGSGAIVGDGTNLTIKNFGSAPVITFDNAGGLNISGTTTVDGSAMLKMGAASGNSTLGGPVVLKNYAKLEVVGGAQLTVSGVVSDDVITGVNKLGDGRLVLANAANTYTGPTVVKNGVLEVATLADGGLPSSLGASSADPANLKLEAGTLHYSGPAVTTNRGIQISGDAAIQIDNAATFTNPFTGAFNMTKTGAGSLIFNPPVAATYNLAAGQFKIYSGMLVLDGGPGTVYSATGNFWAIMDGTTGGLELKNQATLEIGSGADAWNHFGYGANGKCTLTMSGNTAITVNCGNGGFDLGDAGAECIATLSGNAKITATGEFRVGFSKGDATLNDSSSIVAVNLNVGNYHSQGLLTLNANAKATVSGVTTVGQYASTAAEIAVKGSAQLINTGNIQVGYNWGDNVNDLGIAAITVNGSGAKVSTSGAIILGANGGGGAWNQVAGETTSTLPVILGEGDYSDSLAGQTGAHSVAVLNLNGGTLIAPALKTKSAVVSTNADDLGATRIHPVQATVNFNGGVLKASASSADLIATDDPLAILTLNVLAGGAKIDTNGFNETITKSLGHAGAVTDGGLTKNGAGILTLTGAISYDGPTLVNGGRLSIDNGLATTLTVVSGVGAFSVGNTNATTVVNAASIKVDTLTIGSGFFAASSATAVPEPGTWVLLALAGLSLVPIWRRKQS